MKINVINNDKILINKTKAIARNQYLELKKYFLKSKKIDYLQIVIFDNHRAFETEIERPLRSWETSLVKNEKILILNPKIENNKHFNQQNYQKILKHELAHILYNNMIPSGVPYWLNEGLSYNLSGQNFNKSLPLSKCSTCMNYFDTFDEKIYLYSPCFVNHLIKEVGLNKIMDFILSFSREVNSKENFNKQFSKLFPKTN